MCETHSVMSFSSDMHSVATLHLLLVCSAAKATRAKRLTSLPPFLSPIIHAQAPAGTRAMQDSAFFPGLSIPLCASNSRTNTPGPPLPSHLMPLFNSLQSLSLFGDQSSAPPEPYYRSVSSLNARSSAPVIVTSQVSCLCVCECKLLFIYASFRTLVPHSQELHSACPVL